MLRPVVKQKISEARAQGIPVTRTTSGGGIGSLFNTLGKAASVAAPFLPGPWGAVAGIAGGLMGANNAQRDADARTNEVADLARQQASLYQQNAPEIMRLYLDNATGDSYGSLANELYSDAAIDARADAVFDPSRLRADYARYWEETEGAYDNAVNAANADASRRGLGIRGNTGLTSRTGDIRIAQGQDNAAFRRSLLSDLLDRRANYRLGQQDARAALRTQGLGARERALGGAANLATGSAQGAMGTLGGLAGMYQDRANQASQGVGGLIQAGAESGVFRDVGRQVGGTLSRIFGRRNRTPGIAGGGGYAGPTGRDSGMSSGGGMWG